MKIDIVTKEEYATKTYKPVIIHDNGTIDLYDISDSECTEIKAMSVIGKFKNENLRDSLNNLVKKLRIGGTLIISETDCNIVCRQLLSGSLSEENFNKIISNKNSLPSLKYVAEVLKSNGLKIKTQRLNGLDYQIIASRG